MALSRAEVEAAVAASADTKQRTRKKKVAWSISELDQELAWRRWFPQVDLDWTLETPPDIAEKLHAAFLAFCEENVFIKFPGKGRIPFKLREAQRQVAMDFIVNRQNLALKARQIGFSTLVAAYVLWCTFGWDDRQIVLLSKNERDAVKLLAKARYAYRSMPEWVRVRGPELIDKTMQRMTFDNESMLESLPSGNDPARGESLFLIVMDEIGLLPNAEEAWAAVEASTDLGGRTIALGTAKGEGTFFHEKWLGSSYGTNENGFFAIFHGWDAVDTRTQAWYDEKVRTLPAWQVHQEYPSNPEEAFIGSGNPFFNLDILKKFTVDTAAKEFTIQGSSRRSIDVWEGGPLTIFEPPDEQNRYTYAIGVDVAFGLEHGDFTCAWVICVNTGRPVAVWHGHMDPDLFGENVLPALGWFYRDALIAPEINNHGISVLKALQRVKYRWIYKRRTFTKRVDTPLESMGWLTTNTSKPLLADELQMWLRDVENVPHKRTLHELKTFTRDTRGRLGGSPHDDCVIALGIAVQALKYARTEHVSSETSPEKVKGSFAWWERKLGGGSRGGNRLTPVS